MSDTDALKFDEEALKQALDAAINSLESSDRDFRELAVQNGIEPAGIHVVRLCDEAGDDAPMIALDTQNLSGPWVFVTWASLPLAYLRLADIGSMA